MIAQRMTCLAEKWREMLYPELLTTQFFHPLIVCKSISQYATLREIIIPTSF